MNLPHSPRPPKWPYFLGDGVLLVLAGLIGLLAPSPLSATALSMIFGCVALGSVLGVLPFLLDFAAGQHEAEAALQLKLEAQNTRLHQSAETIASIAGQLKSAHEATARAVHTAETLPYRLQEKIAEFTTQLQTRDDEEKATMLKELEALRDAEGQRLTAIAEKIQAATKEFLATEQQVMPALTAAVKQSRELEPALVSATARSEKAMTQAAVELQSAFSAVEVRVRQTIVAAENVDSRLSDRAAALRHLEREIDAALQKKIDQLHAAVCAVETAAPRAARRIRHEAETTEQEIDTSDEAQPAAPAPALPVMQLTAFPRGKRDPIAPSPPGPLPEEAPQAASAAGATETDPATASDPASATETPPKREPRRKPTTRSLGEAVLPGFAEPEIVYDDDPAATAAPTKTADGYTRLLVTAYIGIGNKVFIRGDGPGLSRDKGIPMEFVSIGKWSWETSDAVDPVTIQLFKNDDLPAQGEPLSLPPGHHLEATPVFREPDPF
ncbi:MAG: hypothetical protein IPL39_24505 [Opitutaceae bacterium]|nr:hypothetical protein [Opitutaceae bacterium]